jgi:hypothetical protein
MAAIRTPPASDIALAVVLTLFGLLITVFPAEDDHGLWLDSVVIVAASLPVLWRRTAPLTAAAALAVGVVVSGIPTFEQVRCGVAIPLLVLYAVGSRRDRGAATGGLALVLAGMAFLSVTDVNLTPAVLWFVVPLCTGVWAVGCLVRSRDLVAGELAERSQALERQRAQTAQLAVEVERSRLAAEIDAVTRRRLYEMIALADAGRAESFAQIERSARESLNDMRGLLGVLRSDAR